MMTTAALVLCTRHWTPECEALTKPSPLDPYLNVTLIILLILLLTLGLSELYQRWWRK